MTKSLYHLAYFSRNALVQSTDRVEEEVAQILHASRRNNAEVGVTGALLFNSSCFAQALEGPLDAVEQTFERIQRDPRHSDVTVLALTAIEAREFPAWSMAFAGRLEESRGNFTSFTQSGVRHAGHAAGELYQLLHGLVLQEEGTS